jgi:hypothetical protein
MGNTMSTKFPKGTVITDESLFADNQDNEVNNDQQFLHKMLSKYGSSKNIQKERNRLKNYDFGKQNNTDIVQSMADSPTRYMLDVLSGLGKTGAKIFDKGSDLVNTMHAFKMDIPHVRDIVGRPNESYDQLYDVGNNGVDKFASEIGQQLPMVLSPSARTGSFLINALSRSAPVIGSNMLDNDPKTAIKDSILPIIAGETIGKSAQYGLKKLSNLAKIAMSKSRKPEQILQEKYLPEMFNDIRSKAMPYSKNNIELDESLKSYPQKASELYNDALSGVGNNNIINTPGGLKEDLLNEIKLISKRFGKIKNKIQDTSAIKYGQKIKNTENLIKHTAPDFLGIDERELQHVGPLTQKTYKDFMMSPTVNNLHKLQSNIGEDVRSANNNQVKIVLNQAREKTKSILENYLSKTPDAYNKYKNAEKLYLNYVSPFKNPVISQITGNKEISSNIDFGKLKKAFEKISSKTDKKIFDNHPISGYQEDLKKYYEKAQNEAIKKQKADKVVEMLKKGSYALPLLGGIGGALDISGLDPFHLVSNHPVATAALSLLGPAALNKKSLSAMSKINPKEYRTSLLLNQLGKYLGQENSNNK